MQRQGQVEMSSPDLSVGNTSTNFLCHKSVVDKLRGKSRVSLDTFIKLKLFFRDDNIIVLAFYNQCLSYQSLEENEIYKMERCKDALKQIMQLEWKQRVLQNKLEDLKEKQDIKMLRLSNQQQDTRVIQFLNITINIFRELHLFCFL